MKAILISLLFLCFMFTVKSQTTSNSKDNVKYYVIYHSNGNIKTVGNFVDNKREGEWTYYYENGKVGLKKNFNNGKEIGEWSYYDQNGNLSMKIDDITKSNKELAHYKDGALMSKNTYSEDKKVENKNNSNGNIIINKKF